MLSNVRKRFQCIFVRDLLLVALLVTVATSQSLADEQSSLDERDKKILECLQSNTQFKDCEIDSVQDDKQDGGRQLSENPFLEKPSIFSWPRLKGNNPAEVLLQKPGLVFEFN